MFSPYTCTYCGSPSDSLDHVVPQSYTNSTSFSKDLVVPCCRECNTLLSNTFNHTISDRCYFLIPKYQKRYKRELNMPDWTEQELNEVSEDMANFVSSSLSFRDETKLRVENLKFVANLNPSIQDVWK